MTKMLGRFPGLGFVLTGCAFVLAFAAGWSAYGQPATWNYTAPNNVSTATYPGDAVIAGNVTISGVCTGCSSGGAQLNLPQTWTAPQFFSAGLTGTGALSSSTIFSLTLPNIGEKATITAAAPSATTNYDVLTQSVQDYTTNAANNWTLNLRGSAGVSLNSLMVSGQAVTVAMVTTQGGTAFFNNAVTIDGGAVTPKWQGGVPTAGNTNGLDVYTYTVIKTAAATFTVLATQAQFK